MDCVVKAQLGLRQRATRHRPEAALLRALVECKARRIGKAGSGHLSAIGDLKFVTHQHCGRPTPPLLSCDGIGQVKIWDTARPSANPLCTVSAAHIGSVNGLAVSETTSLFVSCGDDSFVKLWDPELAIEPLRVFRGHSSFACGCAFSGAYPLVGSVSLDATARLWDTRTPDAVFVFNLRTAARSVAFVPGTSSLLLTAGNEGVFLWDVRRHSSFLAAVEASDPTELNSAFAASAVPSTPAGRQLRRVSISPTPSTPAVSGARSANAPPQSPATFSSRCLFFNSPMPSGRTAGRRDSLPQFVRTQEATADRPLASFHDGNTSLELRYDRLTRAYRQPFTGHTGAPYSVVASSDGCHIVTSACDNTSKLWDLHQRRGKSTFDGADLSHSTVPTLSGGDSMLACGSADGNVCIWDTTSGADASAPNKARQGGGNTALRIHAHHFPVTAACWVPGNLGLVSGDTSGTIQCIIP